MVFYYESKAGMRIAYIKRYPWRTMWSTMRFFSILLIWLLSVQPVLAVHLQQQDIGPSANPATLVKDISPQTNGINPIPLATTERTFYFLNQLTISHYQLWKSDGTGQGTELVKDDLIIPGSRPYVIEATVIDETLYFLFNNELWQSDGSTAGTKIIKSFAEESYNDAPPIYQLFHVNSTLFFFAAKNYILSLWRSDGTAVGTMPIKGIVPCHGDPYQCRDALGYLVNVEGTLYFKTYGDSGFELWKSDGTPQGTVRIKTIDVYKILAVAGRLFMLALNDSGQWDLWYSDGDEASTVRLCRSFESAIANSTQFTNLNGRFFFTISTGDSGSLWTSDGTAAGTLVVKNFSTAAPIQLTNVDEQLFFTRSLTGTAELWTSDGTQAGTHLVGSWLEPTPTPGLGNLTAFHDTLFFVGGDTTSGIELWKSDGTAGGTGRVADINLGSPSASPTNLFLHADLLYFSADDGGNGAELWQSDGTAAGTRRVRDINAGPLGSNPTILANLQDRFLFLADDGFHGAEFWASDGTNPGTYLLNDINQTTVSTEFRQLVSANGLLFFTVGSAELWRSDGTAPGTMLLKRFDYVNENGQILAPTLLTSVKNTLFFVAYDRQAGLELWNSDGTVTGTRLVMDLQLEDDWGFPSSFAAINDNLFYIVDSVFWMSDGTAAGTHAIKALNTPQTRLFWGEPTNLNGVIYVTFVSALNWELWATDGTTAGTILIKSVASNQLCYPVQVAAQGILFFLLNGANQWELWKSDDSEVGTIQLLSTTTVSPTVAELVSTGSHVFFRGHDDSSGSELWISDGTTAGTMRVKDIQPGPADSFPAQLTPSHELVFFTISDSLGGKRLWRSDGSVAGTLPVTDTVSNQSWPPVEDYISLFGNLLFAGNSAITGTELWVGDGVTGHLHQVQDLWPGTGSGKPAQFTLVDDVIFFTANDGLHGTELWLVPWRELGITPFKIFLPLCFAPGADEPSKQLAPFSDLP